ncbi:uncharacterized protein SPAPADRAFT_142465 [Spathaspora passalidarum NRRL Y-27907]|uniref:Nucleoporin Nup120/160 beta-propeller domain-containing protein n=1 Tax=Spathaspora passalidarum (strain NRRL Y-27907 / 11-Y1) TaxID=619300 RepID=G3ASZ1_SPAPN|nr:uncharacterized protein SPAPADRAFT_142465 [Spathaspora passalidarum NRRL Y-27907]EGW30773.1 hypothetical protein SPAPADRAFT_142465 [Spathaspora passalidarum NRRL Y-27907]
MTYSKSNVITYEDHLDVHYVKLPLKYNESTVNLSPKEQFNNSLVKSGKLLKVNSIVDLVSCSVLQDQKTVKLVPIVKSNSLDFKYQEIQVRLPNTLLVHAITSEQDQIILDLVDETFLFINIVVKVNDFIYGNKLSLDKFDSWCHISIPYSFELANSSPYYLNHLNSHNLIVSLSNGQLIHFKRDEILSDFTVNQIAQHTPFSIFGLFSNKTVKEINGISNNLVVDSVLLSENTLLTLTISKWLKVWNLQSGQLLNSVFVGDETDNWLTLIPNKYMQLIQFNNQNYLTLFVNDDTDGYKFKLFEVDTLTELSQFEFTPSTDVNWFIQDFTVEVKQQLKYHILFKSNVYSILSTYSIATDNGAIIEITKSITKEDIEEVSPHHTTEYYINKIFNSGLYNQLIVNTSIALLEPHLTHPIEDHSRNSVSKSFSGANELQFWFKLDSLCQEFLKLSQESLAIVSYENSILSLQVNSLGVFRTSHYYQQELTPKLTQIFGKFKEIISQKSFHKLHQHLLFSSSLTTDNIGELFQAFISDKLSEAEIQQLIVTLESIPDIVTIVQSLIGTNSFELIDGDYDKSISLFVKLDAIASFKSIKSSHESILINLVVLFVICQTNDELLHMINSIISILKNYDLLELIFNTCFRNGQIESEKISDLGQSLFWNGVVDHYPKLKSLIASLKLNDSFDLLGNIMSNHEFITNIVIELINREQAKFLYKNFLSKLNDYNIDDRLLIGLIHLINFNPEQVYNIFKEFAPFRQLTKVKINDTFNPLIQAIYDNKESDYYHILAQLCQAQSTKNSSTSTTFIQVALKFELAAIETSSNNDYYLNVFDVALSISDYSLVAQSLPYISDLKPYLTKLITRLISEKRISIIFPPNNQSYVGHFKLIDGILLDMANQENDMVSALRLYEYLYSWRLLGISEDLADKRGAIESLYAFINRFKDSGVDAKWRLKILEVYMIILNVLKGLGDGEQWLLKQGVRRRVITVDDVKIEYLVWLKQLQHDTEMIQVV